MTTVSMREMLEAGVHFGHQTRFWNPKMGQFIFGDRQKIHIINLEHTLPLFKDAFNFAGKVASKRGGTVLFVGTKRAARDTVREQAIRCGMPFVNHRWLGGMLTNFKTVKQSIKRLKDLEKMSEDGSFANINKKEALQLTREIEKLEKTLGGIKDMPNVPSAIFVIDVGHEKIAVSEANKLGIPVIGVVDTNNNPAGVDYIIPGNDDAMRAVNLYTKNIADAILEGRESLAGTSGNKDDFVELDDDGSAVEAGEVVEKSASKASIDIKAKEIVESVEAPEADNDTDKNEEVVASASTDVAEPAQTQEVADDVVEPVVAAPVTKKAEPKTVTKKTVTKTTAKKTATKAVTKKATAKKAVAKKAVAKKATAKKTASKKTTVKK